MRTIKCIVVTTAAAIWMTACGGPAANQPLNSAANSNANAKPAAAAPSKESLIALDKQANEAYFKGDAKFFEGFLSDKFVMRAGGRLATKADALEEIAKVKCDIKSWEMTDPQMSMIDVDTYVVSYKGTFDGTCNDGPGGKVQKVTSPIRAASVFVRSGDKWQGAYHGETAIMEDKDASADTGAARKEEPKTDAAKKPAVEDDKMPAKTDDKKSDDKMAKKDDDKAKTDDKMAKADDKSAANSNTAAKPAADPNTDALTKLHNSGWEAWRNKDAAAFDKLLASSVAIVGPDGSWHTGKSDIIKLWTTMDCTGITKTSFHDTFASALSPTVELLTGTGTADGTCDGRKNADLNQTAVYVKEGNDWRLAFMFESPKS